MRRRTKVSAFGAFQPSQEANPTRVDASPDGSPSSQQFDGVDRRTPADGSGSSNVRASDERKSSDSTQSRVNLNSNSSSPRRNSATIPFGLALQRNRSSGDFRIAPIDVNFGSAAAAAAPAPLRERIAAAREEVRNNTNGAEQLVRDKSSPIPPELQEPARSVYEIHHVPSKVTIDMLVDPLLDKDKQTALIRNFGDTSPADAQRHSAGQDNQRQTPSDPARAQPAPPTATGLASPAGRAPTAQPMSRRDLRISRSEHAKAPTTASTSPTQMTKLMTPTAPTTATAPAVSSTLSKSSRSSHESAAPKQSLMTPMPISAASSVLCEETPTVPKSTKARKKEIPTADKISDLLKGYFKVAQTQWSLIGEGSRIRYFVSENKPREECFREGGFVTSAIGSKLRMRKTYTSPFTWSVDLDALAEIWKQFDTSSAVELAIIQNMLKDQRELIRQQQKAIEELQRELQSLRKPR